jgi:hypothetical protein
VNDAIDGRTMARIEETAGAILSTLTVLARDMELDQREALTGTALALASMIQAIEPREARPALRAAVANMLLADAELDPVASHG